MPAVAHLLRPVASVACMTANDFTAAARLGQAGGCSCAALLDNLE